MDSDNVRGMAQERAEGGAANPNVVDIVAQNTETGEVTLAIVENRDWDGSLVRMRQLQDKVNRYLAFALDGEMHRKYPDTAGKPLRLRLYYFSEPDPATLRFLDTLGRELGKLGVRFTHERQSG